MKKLLLIFPIAALLFVPNAYAWNTQKIVTSSEVVTPDGCTPSMVQEAEAAGHSYIDQTFSPGSVVYYMYPATSGDDLYPGCYNRFADYHQYRLRVARQSAPLPESEFVSDYVIYDHIYTDAQCTALHGAGATATGQVEDGSGSSCNVPPPTDDYCQALDPIQFDDVPGSFVDENGVIEAGGCSWSLGKSVCAVFGTSSDERCAVTATPTGAATGAPSSSEDLPPMPDDLDTGWAPGSDSFTPTSDPGTDCPWSYVSDGTNTYCYDGDIAPTGSDYPDSSSRVDYADGSYTVTDGQGNSITYNPDGSLANPDSAPTAPGAGPGGSTTTGENDGCPPWAPEWMCSGDGEGSEGDDEEIELPTESFDFATDAIDWDSGLATSMACPAPMSLNISLMDAPLEISYQPFCDLAGYLRALLIAFAYLSAAFLVFRGLT